MAEFQEVWQELIQCAKTEQTISTYVRESENKVEYDPENDAIVFTSDESNAIPRETWKHAWRELEQERELTRESFKEVTGTYRASIALPFLEGT